MKMKLQENIWKYSSVLLLGIICYSISLYGSFVFDDSEAIVKNKDVMPTTPLTTIFKNDFWGTNISLNSSHKSYRPLTILTYRLNVIFADSKLSAFQFHLVNVLLYALLCVLVIPTLNMLIFKTKKKPHISEKAYLSALLFTVHPVHVESVAALVGRADILSCILFLISFLLYHTVILRQSVFGFFVVVFLIFAAVLCKETAIMALSVCVVYDALYTRTKHKTDSFVKILYDKPFLLRSVGLCIAGVIILYFRFKVMNFEGPVFTKSDNPAAFANSTIARVLTYNYIYFLNFLLLLCPIWLCFDWSMGCIPVIEDFCDIRVIFVVIFWILMCYLIYKISFGVFTSHKIDQRLMGFCFIILPFIPASNLFLKVGFVIAERTLLLPSLGYCFLVVLGLKKLKKLFGLNNQLYYGTFATLCTIFAIRTIERNTDWLTEERLFLSALSVCPLNAKVHYNVAKVAADKGQKQLALAEYRKAIELNPEYEQAMNNLANLLREDRLFEEAEVLLRKAVEVRPNFAAAWMNLGIVLTNLNQSEEAEQCYLTAISHRKKYPDCYYNLGNLYLDLKRNNKALKAWEMAVSYRPTHTAAWSNTLVLLDSMQRYNEALEIGRIALTHNPKSPALHFSIANTLGKLQQFEKAEKHFLEALNFNPYNALYYSNLGVLYHRWGKVDKAREMYKKALQINPKMTTTENNLRKLLNAH